MSLTEIMGILVIPALVGALSGWIYWRAAGRPASHEGAVEKRK